MINKSLIIFYHGGSYGTYVRWLCETLFTDIEIASPFTESGPTTGNSHSFNQKYTITSMYKKVEKLRNNLNNLSSPFIFAHPKNDKYTSVSEEVNNVIDNGYSSIFLYPDKKYKLLALNNWYQKVKQDWWLWQSQENNIAYNLYNNWPVDKKTKFNNISPWIKREFLSFYLLPAWEDQVEWYFPDNYSNDNCQFVSFSTLFDNTRDLLDILESSVSLSMTRNFDSIMGYHKQMLSLQQNKTQDFVYNSIIDALQNNSFFEWQTDDLTLVTEACIQHYLRNTGIELKCDGLNQFPTNTNDLKRVFC